MGGAEGEPPRLGVQLCPQHLCSGEVTEEGPGGFPGTLGGWQSQGLKSNGKGIGAP